MTIDKFGGTYTLTCDNCGKELKESFDDFYDAVEAKKTTDGKAKK